LIATHVARREDGLLYVSTPEDLSILFMAPYAPDGPDYLMNPYAGDGTYPEYHAQVYNRLKRLRFRVESTSKPYAIVHAGGAVDYVFSLFNRMPIRNSEVFVSAFCEYLNVPYLGAPPNVRAAAEDKYISKVIAAQLGIPVPRGIPYTEGITPLVPPPFAGPYFIKNRFGAASEGISTDNLQDDWVGTRRIVEWFWEHGTDVLVEEYVDGVDVTVPVIGDDLPRPLGVFEPQSDKPGHILTHDLKLTDHLGYREVEVPGFASAAADDALKLWKALGAIDYFRLDYRFDPATGARRFLELNICCYIGEHGPFGMAAIRDGTSIDLLLGHVVAYSVLRQGGGRKYAQRIL
jgi:D-alanine-D-alanine ligase